VRLTWDPPKREKTLLERGLDFAKSQEIFDGVQFTAEDTRNPYGERRYITVGFLAGRLAVLVWTPRGDARHIISMRKANDREKKRFEEALQGKG
jgi:uncharacterized DUF497 family protein